MVKVVLIAKKKNVAVKKFLVVSKGEKVVGGADTQKGLDRILKGKRKGTYYVIENPQVRSAYVEQVKAATVKHWKKSKAAQANLAKQYKKILFGNPSGAMMLPRRGAVFPRKRK